MLDDFSVDNEGYKICEAGDYRDILVFNEVYLFPDNCLFGNSCVFNGGSIFGKYTTFGSQCSFGDWCDFGDYTKFGNGCIFGDGTEFGEHSVFNHDCYFGCNSIIGASSKISDGCKFSANCTVNNSYIAEIVSVLGSVSLDKCYCNYGDIEHIISIETSVGYSCNIILLTDSDYVYAARFNNEDIVVVNDLDEFINALDRASKEREDKEKVNVFKQFLWALNR